MGGGLEPFILATAFIGTFVLCQGVDIISRGNETKSSLTRWDHFMAPTTAMTSKHSSSQRSKRNVINLHNVLKCKNPRCDPFSYLDYACYCGLTMSYSGLPMDGIDKCCQKHDECYGRSTCRMYSHYWWAYPWNCLHGEKPICEKGQGFFARLLGVRKCPQQLCNCDRELADCFSQYPCPSHKMECNPRLSIYNIHGVDDDDYDDNDVDDYIHEHSGNGIDENSGDGIDENSGDGINSLELYLL